jgi:Kef-type K+ transport system membrane component KefB
VLTLVAIVGKLVGSGLGLFVFRRNIWESVVVGFGLNGRGAVELVIATVMIKLSNDLMAKGAISEPLLTNVQFSALVLMAFLTTMIAPITLKWSAMRACTPSEKVTFCSMWDNETKQNESK